MLQLFTSFSKKKTFLNLLFLLLLLSYLRYYRLSPNSSKKVKMETMAIINYKTKVGVQV